ncbi:hypothetical protein Dsin_028043 [Dipteronia sinensis]|uniref:RNase H type-1 domain-containing protein n=1 Tax=Dipteronia sinensis TaxID=43782 RepID=A0AAD9ZR10_9ROSI|nr:hypothetical protein Dsin_028043 [Dipteronia sinensis]
MVFEGDLKTEEELKNRIPEGNTVHSRKVWLHCLSWWEVSSCPNEDIKGWWESWSGLCPSSTKSRIWDLMFFVVVWSIWETRNASVFIDTSACMVRALDMVKFRMVWWFKHHGPGSKESLSSLLLNTIDLCKEDRHSKGQKVEAWTPPMSSDIKFDVDGSVLGKPGPTSIGGVLRDGEGKVLSCMGRNLVIESDSKIAVSWVNSKGIGNFSHVQLIYDTRDKLKSLGGEVKFRSRASNQFTDSLAKMGSSKKGDFVEWGDFG